MEELRDIEQHYVRARRAGNRELMRRLRGEIDALKLGCDLLLADAVAASRGYGTGRSVPPIRVRRGGQ